MAVGRFVVFSGGGFTHDPDDPRLDDYILSLTGRRRPRVGFIPTASGDSPEYVDGFRESFPTTRCEPSVLSLFAREIDDLEAYCLSQDVLYVGGGNTVNLLAIWRAHGLDKALARAAQRGVLLCGLSAGALCWFESGLTDSFGALAPLRSGLGLLPGSFCPHFDSESDRQALYRQLVGARDLPAGFAVDDGVALHFEDGVLKAVIGAWPDSKARRLELSAQGALEERVLEPRLLAERP